MILNSLRTLPAWLLPLLMWLTGSFAYSDAYDITSRLSENPSFHYTSSPEDWRDINMYQLFTDRFFDGNTGNNLSRHSTSGTPWYNQSGSNAENDRHLFQGGDWAGIRQKLDYLKGMGVNCIWISGVQMNEQGIDKRFTPYHAYHPANFYRCEPMFGTFTELKSLIDAAHSNGIYVVIDVVVNHMADLLKYTDCNCNYSGYCENNCGSLGWWDNNVQFGAPFNNPGLFHNNGNIVNWGSYPEYVKGAFLGTEDLRTEDPYVQNELRFAFKNLIDATDCDGFRVDAIKHMEYDFIKQWADDMRKHAAYRGKNNFILFGEYFSYDDSTQASYCKDNGFSFNSTLWFPMQQTLKNVFAYEQGTSQLVDRMNAMSLYGEASDKLVAFMDNHDVDRIALECGSQWENKLRPALTFLYTALPVPCLFYGTEHGFNQGERRNGPPAEGKADFQRETMFNFGFQWGNAYGDKFVTSPLYTHIKKLNELRQQYISLRRGSITQRWSENGKGLFAISRVHGNEESLIAINTDWGTKSCNPSVSKPDGTTFVNALNPSETVVVSGGKVSFSVDSKGSKIFVSGLGNSAVETSCNAVTLTITYKPNGGPLAEKTGSVHIGIGHDGEQDLIDCVMTPSGNNWTYAYALSNATNEVNFWFHDEAQPPKYDNNNNQNWDIDITSCGEPTVDLTWIGNTYQWPGQGEWDPGEPLWINTESYPKTAAIDGSVVFSSNGGTTWTTVVLSANGTVGNNDAWHANLGSFPGGTTIRYAVSLRGRNGTLWDNNSTHDYTTRVNAAATTVTWIGNTYHWPGNGTIEPGNDLWINMESYPMSAGVTGEVVYSSDGTNWQSRALSRTGTIGSNDWWNVNLGSFPPDTIIQYAVNVKDGDGTDHWDNHGGSNFTAIINSAPSSIRWFGNTIQGCTLPPEMGIGTDSSSGVARVALHDLASNALYTIMKSQDLINWTNIAVVNADGVSEFFSVTNNETSASTEPAFYRLRVDWVPGSSVYYGREAMISIETWPIGGATNATLIYTTDNGAHWNAAPMHKTGTRGNNDVWSTSLGSLPLGSTIKYAVEVRDEQGNSLWDNNNSTNFQFQVIESH
jgi:glycosidase